MKNHILQSAKTLILALVIGVGVSYVSAQREGWQVPPGSPPDCPTGYSGCDAPIHVGANDQVKAGGLSVNTLNTVNSAVIGGSLGISLGKNASNEAIPPSYPLHVNGKTVAQEFCFFSDPTKCLTINDVGGNSSELGISVIVGTYRIQSPVDPNNAYCYDASGSASCSGSSGSCPAGTSDQIITNLVGTASNYHLHACYKTI